jgi:hypothetical protein
MRREATAAFIFAAVLLAGCGTTAKGVWVIESWNQGTVTVRHEGLRYQATCEGSIDSQGGSLNVNGKAFADALDRGADPKCDAITPFVGRSVAPLATDLRPAGGMAKGLDGPIVTMAEAGNTLMLKCWRDEQTNTSVLFTIRSVTKIAP